MDSKENETEECDDDEEEKEKKIEEINEMKTERISASVKDVCDLPIELASPSRADYYRPWRYTDKNKSGTSEIKYGKHTDSLKIVLDISQFDQDKITVGEYGAAILVKAVQTEKMVSMGTVSRELTRLYEVPSNIDLSTLSYKITNKRVIIIANKTKLQKSVVKKPVVDDSTEVAL